jgi:protein-disulfide isomerase
MRRFPRAVALAAALLVGGWAAGAVAQPKPLTEEDVNKIITKYVETNAEKIYTEVGKYLLARDAKARAEDMERKLNNPIKDNLAAHTPIRGKAEAPVTIIMYSEFQCPYCEKGANVVAALREKYGDKIRIAYKHFFIPGHDEARPAASAAMAAHKQGKFWEFHDALFANQRNLSEELYLQIAKDLKLDMAKFNADRTSPDLDAIFEADKADSTKLGNRSTPYFLVNGYPMAGAMPVEQFSEIIDAHLKIAEAKAKGGKK